MLADSDEVVIGVDTHQHTHTAAAVTAMGAVLEHVTVPANPRGYRALVGFGRRHGAAVSAVEGTGSLGAGLTAHLVATGERVVEVDRPERPARRPGVKSDDVDAVRSAPSGVGRHRGERAPLPG